MRLKMMYSWSTFFAKTLPEHLCQVTADAVLQVVLLHARWQFGNAPEDLYDRKAECGLDEESAECRGTSLFVVYKLAHDKSTIFQIWHSIDNLEYLAFLCLYTFGIGPKAGVSTSYSCLEIAFVL